MARRLSAVEGREVGVEEVLGKRSPSEAGGVAQLVRERLLSSGQPEAAVMIDWHRSTATSAPSGSSARPSWPSPALVASRWPLDVALVHSSLVAPVEQPPMRPGRLMLEVHPRRPDGASEGQGSPARAHAPRLDDSRARVRLSAACRWAEWWPRCTEMPMLDTPPRASSAPQPCIEAPALLARPPRCWRRSWRGLERGCGS